jgi:NADH-quinone oxidoreductase subunit J
MNVEMILFLVVAAVAVLSALLMITRRNPVQSVLFLILNFFCLAVIYLVLHAQFIAVIQILVYAGAIMVLFLFVIMLLGAEKLPKGDVLPAQPPLAIGAAVILLAEAVILLIQRFQSSALIQDPGTVENSMDSLRAMAMMLFNEYLLPFEVTSILLLVAMVGAIVLTKKEKGAQG